MSILDEIDSGLDVDALRDVSKAVNGLLTPRKSVLMITHYLRLLEYIQPNYIHIMVSKSYKFLYSVLLEIEIRFILIFFLPLKLVGTIIHF